MLAIEVHLTRFERSMTNRTKSVISCCVAMMAGGFTYSQLSYTQLATSMLLKAGIVGVVAGIVAVSLLLVLPPRKAA
jgi:hypothetical protein